MESWSNEAKDLYVYQPGWEVCEKGHAFGPAIRDHYLIHYIVKGKGTYRVGNHTYPLSEGQGFLIMPGEITFYQADDEDPWEYYWIGFNGKQVNKLLEACRLGRHQPILNYNKDDALQRILQKLALGSTKYKVNEYEQIGYAYLFFSILMKSEESSNIPQDEYVNKATKFIQNNYSYPISIEQIANYIGIERTYLFRVFKKILGISPQEYLIQYRLEKGTQLLIQSGMGITEIAYSCGFREVGYFSRCFKKKYGVSPFQYRKQNTSL